MTRHPTKHRVDSRRPYHVPFTGGDILTEHLSNLRKSVMTLHSSQATSSHSCFSCVRRSDTMCALFHTSVHVILFIYLSCNIWMKHHWSISTRAAYLTCSEHYFWLKNELLVSVVGVANSIKLFLSCTLLFCGAATHWCCTILQKRIWQLAYS